jgi:hypothetical protein
MRVLVSPQAEVGLGTLATDVADRLAGPGGTVVSLRTAGIGNFSRRLSEAEVALLREAALGERPERWVAAEKPGEGVVGYVCVGRPAAAQEGARAAGAGALIAVTDHAGLTWRSPLTGPNDDSLGPRFPSMTGVYAPEVVSARLVGRAVESSENAPGKSIPSEGMIVVPGIVAGVFDDGRLSDHEREMVRLVGCLGVSVELVPVVIVMAHLGLRVAAAVLLHSEGREIPGGGS